MEQFIKLIVALSLTVVVIDVTTPTFFPILLGTYQPEVVDSLFSPVEIPDDDDEDLERMREAMRGAESAAPERESVSDAVASRREPTPIWGTLDEATSLLASRLAEEHESDVLRTKLSYWTKQYRSAMGRSQGEGIIGYAYKQVLVYQEALRIRGSRRKR